MPFIAVLPPHSSLKNRGQKGGLTLGFKREPPPQAGFAVEPLELPATLFADVSRCALKPLSVVHPPPILERPFQIAPDGR